MDAVDIKILNCLEKNARMNASVIGKRINLSVSAVIERIKKLEQNGIIQGYTIRLDEIKAGFYTSAVLSIRLEHPKYNEEFSSCIRKHPAVSECYYITGDFDYMVKVVTESNDALTKALNDIKQMSGVSLTRTSVILDVIKPHTAVIPALGDVAK